MQTLLFTELGFPILLVNPKMIEVRGHKLPDLNMKALQDAVFRALIDKPSRLTGAEVRFIRKHLRVTQKDLARVLEMANHTVVSQWESKEDAVSGMNRSAEALLRTWMVTVVNEPERIRGLLEGRFTETLRVEPSGPLSIDMAEVA